MLHGLLLPLQPSDRWRTSLLSRLPPLRAFLRSKLWPERINFGFTVYAFAAINAILFLGPQDRDHNFALNAFWCYWCEAPWTICGPDPGTMTPTI